MKSPKALKNIAQIFTAQYKKQSSDINTTRVIINSQYIDIMDPFLHLVHADFKLPSGFPEHPHRGFETLTYLVKGEINHEDSTGKAGILKEGGAQWMTAGKGIVHSEVPNSYDEVTSGFQLWINLPKDYKYCEPLYQQQQCDDIPTYQDEQMTAKVVAGQVQDVQGTIQLRQPCQWIDFTFHKENAEYFHLIPKQWNSLIYILQGSLQTQNFDQSIKKEDVVQYQQTDNDEYLNFKILEQGTRFILLAGKPLNEPIAFGGPFVLNEEWEVKKAYDDYKLSKNGFETSKNWKAQNQKLKIRNKSV